MKGTLNNNDAQNKKNIWDAIACTLFLVAITFFSFFENMVGGIIFAVMYAFLKTPIWGYVAQQEKQLQIAFEKKLNDEQSSIRKELKSIAEEKGKLSEREKSIKKNEEESAKQIKENNAKIAKQIRDNNEKSKHIDDTVERKVQEKFHAHKEEIRRDLYQQEKSLIEKLGILRQEGDSLVERLDTLKDRVHKLEEQKKENLKDLEQLSNKLKLQEEALPSTILYKMFDATIQSNEKTQKNMLEMNKQNNQQMQQILETEKRAQNQVLQSVSNTMQHVVSEQRQMFSEQSQRSAAVIGGLAHTFQESTRELNQTTRKVLHTTEKVTKNANKTYTINNQERDRHDETMKRIDNQHKEAKLKDKLERKKLDYQNKLDNKRLDYQKEVYDSYRSHPIPSVLNHSVKPPLSLGYDSDDERASSVRPRGSASDYDVD
jgi:myosin heavy subunit